MYIPLQRPNKIFVSSLARSRAGFPRPPSFWRFLAFFGKSKFFGCGFSMGNRQTQKSFRLWTTNLLKSPLNVFYPKSSKIEFFIRFLREGGTAFSLPPGKKISPNQLMSQDAEQMWICNLSYLWNSHDLLDLNRMTPLCAFGF